MTNAVPITLAVDWLSFDAYRQGNGARLDWSATNESSVGYYEVEQSLDGSAFYPLGSVTADNGAGTDNYSFQVTSLSNGINYFRIKRVGMNDISSYSTVQEIENVARFSVAIEPNPIMGDMLNIRISSPQAGRANVSILGMDGRVLLQLGVALQDGVTDAKVDISHISAGTYITRVSVGYNQATEKFVKL
jgi:hypothetical protein